MEQNRTLDFRRDSIYRRYVNDLDLAAAAKLHRELSKARGHAELDEIEKRLRKARKAVKRLASVAPGGGP